jgi:hypothetical protein
MKFNAWSMKRIREGKKTLTSRSKRYENDSHVRAIVGPLPIWFICSYLFKDEGAESPAELKSVIDQIWRRHVSYDLELYVHVLNVEKILEGDKKG